MKAGAIIDFVVTYNIPDAINIYTCLVRSVQPIEIMYATIFYPVVSNADPKNYTFSIIDRWGQIVFETSDPTMGWDGKISSSGLDATNDVFLYRIEITTQTDELIVKRGYVTLIR